MIKERLASLSQEIRTTFQPQFVYLVFPDKVQHFPAREWTKEQFLEELTLRLGQYTLEVWEGMVIAISTEKEELALLPRFASVAEVMV